MPDLAALLLRAKALATGDRFFGALEHPGRHSSTSGALVVSGWTFSRRAPIDRVEALLDGAVVATVPYGIHRPDVAAIFPTLTDGRCGYFLRTWLDASVAGSRRLEIRATDRHGNIRRYARTLVIADCGLRPSARLGAPRAWVEGRIADSIARPRVDEWLRIPADSPSLAILDWDGTLAACDAGAHRVFSSPAGGATIPYIDCSVDVVAIGERDETRVAE